MTLVGSILSNLLLVTGTCFLIGGLKFHLQTFSTNAIKAYSSMLVLAAIGVCIPSGETLSDQLITCQWLVLVINNQSLLHARVSVGSTVSKSRLLVIGICL